MARPGFGQSGQGHGRCRRHRLGGLAGVFHGAFLLSLSIVVLSLFADSDTIRSVLEGLVTHYFPASSSRFNESVGGLLGNAVAFGTLALGSLIFSANGMFTAANRSINRVMRADQPIPFGDRM